MDVRHEMQPSRYPMIAVEEALATVLRLVPEMDGEWVGLREAFGRVLAEDVHAGEDLPRFAAASVDGYALVAADGEGQRQVLAEITAGQAARTPVGSGTAVRIMTGAPLPPGADAVIMVEDTAEHEGWLTVRRPVKAGENVIPVGLDAKAQQLLLPRRTQIGPAEAALLATVDRVRVKVYRRPAVAVLSTGDEVIEPGAAPGDTRIRDSNRYGLMAAVAETGALPVSAGIVHDDFAEQERRVREALEGVDVLLTSGGVSVGSRDLIKVVLERLGRVHFGRVAVKPGKPLTFATVGAKPVFGLPGFPVSSLVTFELFVRPALLQMQGRQDVQRPETTVFLEHEINRTSDRRMEFQRAVVREEGGRLLACTNGPQASSRLLSLVGANALLRIPIGEGKLRAGEAVQALVVGPVG